MAKSTNSAFEYQLKTIEKLMIVNEGEEAGLISGTLEGKFLILTPDGNKSSLGNEKIEPSTARSMYGRIKELLEERERRNREKQIPTAEVRKTGLDRFFTDLFGRKK